MSAPLRNDEQLARPGRYTGRRHGRTRIGLHLLSDAGTGKGPWYWCHCDCGQIFKVRADNVLGPRCARGCQGCRRAAILEGNDDLEMGVTHHVGRQQKMAALEAYKRLTPEQQKDFTLIMHGRTLNYRNVVEAIGMAREGLTDADREMFRPKRPQELRVEISKYQGEHRTVFFRERRNVRHE